MASVSLKNLNKYFGSTLVVNNVSVDIADGAVSYTHLRAHET